MAKLTAAQRRMLPKSAFAIPERAPGPGSYPIPDASHQANALSRVEANGSPEEKAKVRRAVAAKRGGSNHLIKRIMPGEK